MCTRHFLSAEQQCLWKIEGILPHLFQQKPKAEKGLSQRGLWWWQLSNGDCPSEIHRRPKKCLRKANWDHEVFTVMCQIIPNYPIFCFSFSLWLVSLAWAAICGVARSRTWLKRLSSSSQSFLCQICFTKRLAFKKNMKYYLLNGHFKMNDLEMIRMISL